MMETSSNEASSFDNLVQIKNYLLLSDFLRVKKNLEVWQYFSSNTMSIEILKEDKLHRINFPVTCRVSKGLLMIHPIIFNALFFLIVKLI
jgi:hypothetical protein